MPDIGTLGTIFITRCGQESNPTASQHITNYTNAKGFEILLDSLTSKILLNDIFSIIYNSILGARPVTEIVTEALQGLPMSAGLVLSIRD